MLWFLSRKKYINYALETMVHGYSNSYRCACTNVSCAHSDSIKKHFYQNQ